MAGANHRLKLTGTAIPVCGIQGPCRAFRRFRLGVRGWRKGGREKTCQEPNAPCEEEVAMSRVSVRYIIDDVPAAMRFDTTLLGFTLEQDASPAFASVVRDGVRLLRSGDGSSGKRPLPAGRRQEPGGWN